MERPTIALTMIVRDEAPTLGRCLSSVVDAVDQLIVVDTGSVDETANIACDFGARVEHFRWIDDFACARQFALDLASADWVFWLDADDVVEGAGRIRTSVAEAGPDLPGFRWRYVTARDAHGLPACTFWRERCVRRGRGFRWEGRVHEVLNGPAAPGLRKEGDVVVDHRPLPARPRNPRRNLDILLAEQARLGSRTPRRTLLYLGLEHRALGHHAEAERFLLRFLETPGWAEQDYHARLALAEVRRAMGRLAAAARAAEAARELLPDRSDACFSLAETAYAREDWPAVIRWCEAGMARPATEGDWLTYPLDTGYRWIIHYTNALYRAGRVVEALKWTERALAIRPDDRWHLANRTFFRNRLPAASTGVR